MEVKEEASEIGRFLAKRLGRRIRFGDAVYLASYDFPLEQKMELMEALIEKQGAGIYSPLYFRQEFTKAEVAYHKGPLPKPHSSFSSIRDILSPPTGG